MRWTAGGTNTEYHFKNAERAAKGIYGKAFQEKMTVVLPDGNNRVFDIFAADSLKGNYRFYKNVKSKEPGVTKYLVYAKKEGEYEYVTVSKDYLIIYKYLKQVMVIYKLK